MYYRWVNTHLLWRTDGPPPTRLVAPCNYGVIAARSGAMSVLIEIVPLYGREEQAAAVGEMNQRGCNTTLTWCFQTTKRRPCGYASDVDFLVRSCHDARLIAARESVLAPRLTAWRKIRVINFLLSEETRRNRVFVQLYKVS